jgi:hypothetical protein
MIQNLRGNQHISILAAFVLGSAIFMGKIPELTFANRK